ncbi:hypothetical protein ACWEKM_11945 [Streptomyces sp. NPDC004752]
MYFTTRVDLAAVPVSCWVRSRCSAGAGEEPGRLSGRLAVRVAGGGVLDQESACGPGAPGGWDGPDVLAEHRVGNQLEVVRPELTNRRPGMRTRCLGRVRRAFRSPGPPRRWGAVAVDGLRLRWVLDAELMLFGQDAPLSGT